MSGLSMSVRRPRRWAAAAIFFAAASTLPQATPSYGADVFAGQEIYEAHCARCRGRNGRPLLPNVPNFYQGERLDAPDGLLVNNVKRGQNLMPSFDRILKDRDILNALSYIRTLER